MGITYRAFDNAGNANLSSYLTGLDSFFGFGSPANQYAYSSGGLSSSTVYYSGRVDDDSDALFVGHVIAAVTDSVQFSVEGELTGTVGTRSVAEYVNVAVAFDAYTIDALLAENDTLTGNASNNVLEGFGGNDRINGSFGDDFLFGAAGADQLFGGWGADTLYGGTENDVLSGEDGDDRLYGGDGVDSIVGGVGADTMDGGDGNDWIRGFEDADAIYAGAGDDLADGGDGDDAIYGGDGIDNLVGGLGADRLDGGADIDTIDGGEANDAIYGGDGDDRLTGGRGADLLDGGAGSDFVSYFGNSAAVTATIGRGAAKGGDAEGDRLVSIEYVVGSAFADRLTGSGASETLNGSDGNDRLAGGGGDDVLIGSAGADRLDGGAGRDTANYSANLAGVFIDLTMGTASGDQADGDSFVSIEDLTGSDFADRLTGSDAANQLRGALGVDTLIGAGGDDILLGESGNDVLTGGAGRDTFRFGSAFGVDTITDWQDRSDRISFVGGTVDDFSDLTISAGPTGVVTIASADGTIRVNNAQAAKFTAADFAFASSTAPSAVATPDSAHAFHWMAAAHVDHPTGLESFA